MVFGKATKPARFADFCRIPCACHAKQHLNFEKWSEPPVFLTCWLRNVLGPTTACTFSTAQLPKVVREWCVFLYMLTSKCASRRNGVHFFDISTSKSSVHVLCTFWLGNALRATTACTCSTSQLPKAVQSWDVLYILTSKCASRHNGVLFFISHLARWLRTRRFSEPTFRPSGATNHWRNTVFRDFPTFSRTCELLSSYSFSSLIFSLLLFSLLLFSSLTLPICFSSVRTVGSLTCKLPSINIFSQTKNGSWLRDQLNHGTYPDFLFNYIKNWSVNRYSVNYGMSESATS